jgi:transcription termination factor Rho
MGPQELQRVWQLRRVLNALDIAQATELMITGLNKTGSNKEFLEWVEKELRTNGRGS